MSRLTTIGKWLFGILGVVAFLLVALAFTDLPYYAYHNLGTRCEPLDENPEIIVVLGGSGMPSPDGLIRTYYAADAALKHEDARIIIAHPKEEDSSTYQLDLMAHELIIRGVDSTRISYEPNGFNTHSQAVNVAQLLEKQLHSRVLVITTPEHMFRAIRSFQKAGLKNVGGLPSFENPIDEEELLDEKTEREIGLSWRYNIWSYLRYEILVLREYCAITYYKLKGWI